MMLSPYRVLDLTDTRAELASFVLAGMGADVIKVEVPGGSTSRQAVPIDAAQPRDMQSLRFHAFNRGKRSVVLDLTSVQGRDQFMRLVASADFLFENFPPGEMKARGLDFDALREVKPDLVYVAITPFGQDGPYAKHLATDLTISAMGGAVALNGEPDRRPLRSRVPQTWYHGAMEGVVGAMLAHHRRLTTGQAQFVDVSIQAAVFWTGLNAMIAHAIQGRNVERSGTVLQLSTASIPLCYPCKDGEVVLVATLATLKALIPWMVSSGVVSQAWADAEDWESYETRMLTAAPLTHTVEHVRAMITKFTLAHTKSELFLGGIARNATLAAVNTTADVLGIEHLTIRDFWRELKLPDGRTLRAPGAYVKASKTPIEWTRPAPRAGEHQKEVFDALRPKPVSADSAARVSARSELPARALPLAGVKFADFSWIGVGPITAKALADHGANVIRIETDEPVDRLRLVGPFKDDVIGINRCQFFASFNTSKRSLNLNLKHPQGIAIAKKLIAWADVVLDSFTAGTMDKLGLGYDFARRINPSVIMASTCLMGQTGPAGRLSGYGYHAAAVSGFYEITGWDDRPPAGPFNAYTDTIAPRFLAASLMAALDHRRRTGEGQFIDQAQMESSLHFLSPELLATQITGKSPRRAANESPTAAPHDTFPCLGQDQWCAIAVVTDEKWRALVKVLCRPAWPRDPVLPHAAGRLAPRERIYDELAKFTALHASRALMDTLQANGIPAGMVQRSSDHMEDPQLEHRHFFRPLQHPEMGEVPYEGHPYQIAGYGNGPLKPAPCIGEHSFEVLQEALGMSDEEVAEAMAAGAVG